MATRHEQINITYSSCQGHDIDSFRSVDPLCIPSHLPADIAMIQAQERLKALTKELRGHNDMDEQLAILQKKVGDTKKKTNTMIKGMEQRLDMMEELWSEQLDAEERKLMSVTGRREIKNNNSSDIAPNAESRLLNLTGKAREISALESKLEKFPIGKDEREQLKEIKTKLDDINKEMERQGQMVSQLESQNPDAVYGVCELTENYKSSIDCLNHAISSLDHLSHLPAISRVKGGQSTQDEIVKVRDALKVFLGKLKKQLSSACIIGSRVCSPQNSTKNIKSESSGSIGTTPIVLSEALTNATHSTVSNESLVGRLEHKDCSSLNSSYTSSCQTAFSNVSTAVAPISGNVSPATSASVSVVSAVCPPSVFSSNPKTTVPPPSIQSPVGENGGNINGKIVSPAKTTEKQGK